MTEEFAQLDLGTAFAGASTPPLSGAEDLTPEHFFDTPDPVNSNAGSLNGDSSVHENADAAVQYNTTINDACTQLAQAVFAELYGPQGDEDSGAPAVTQRARDQAEQDKAEKRADLAEAQEQAAEDRREAKEAENRAFQDFLNSADFEKLAAYYAGNPEMLDKVRDRLVEKGTSPSKAEKGAKEFQEFIELKKKEKEGTLTSQDKERLAQIKKSEEFKLVTQAVAAWAQNEGLQINITSSQKTCAEAQRTLSQTGNVDELVSEMQGKESKGTDINGKRDEAYALFKSAPNISEKFVLASADLKTPANSVDLNKVDNIPPPTKLAISKIEVSANNFM